MAGMAGGLCGAVSTHSRLKAAGAELPPPRVVVAFQHTAA